MTPMQFMTVPPLAEGDYEKLVHVGWNGRILCLSNSPEWRGFSTLVEIHGNVSEGLSSLHEVSIQVPNLTRDP